MYSLKINLIGCDEHVLPRAARDLLQRWAVFDVEYPNVATVQKNVLAKEGETRLLVIHIRTVDDVAAMKRLNASYPRFPILAAVDATDDPTIVMKCMRAGALQVVQAPVLVEELQEALDCIAAKQAGLSRLAKLVTVAGSVGGCGATSVAFNLVYELARRTQARCVLMELALRKGVLANHLAIAPRYTTTELVADIRRVDTFILQGALTEVAENFCVLAGPYDTIQTEKVDLEHTMQLVQMTRQLASWLILDVPSTYDDVFFRSLTSADQIVLVAEQTVAGIRGVQMLCDSLAPRRPLVVINRYDNKSTKRGLCVERIQEFLPGCDICTLSNDLAVGAAMNGGQALRLYSSRSPVLADIDALLERISPELVDAPAMQGMARY